MNFIAEICQNHKGDLNKLLEMTYAAAEGGATHIKTQHIYVKNLTFRTQFENGLISNSSTHDIKRPWETEYSRLKELELSLSDCDKFIDTVLELGLKPLTTCFARSDIQTIYDLGFQEIKVASYDCPSFQLIRELTSNFKKIYVSTGASFDEEVKKTNTILSESSLEYELLHCVTIYPTPLNFMNLNRINWLKELSPNVGFSDHSHVGKNGILAAKVATLYDVSSIERHFTTLDASETKDGPVSIQPNQLRELINFNKLSKEDKILSLNDEYPNWEELHGHKNYLLTKEEMLNRNYYRGRFASPMQEQTLNNPSKYFIYNWEETPL
tara:strand:- start:52579 stop:53556 length:978 start_codon:yes stop_codon:yes gene_type:complete